jgi:nucleoid DNA-binding protein
MDELVNLVAQKTGISNDQAQKATDIVINFIKDKLPAPVAGQIDGLLAGGGDIKQGLGSLFGKK